MQVTFSTADLADITDLARLNGMIQDQHVHWSPHLFRADWTQLELEIFWRHRLSDQNSTVIVAKEGSQTVGYIWFEIQTRPQDALRLFCRQIYIHHIGVDPGSQGTGIGQQLLARVEDTAKHLQIRDILAVNWTLNSKAQSFFDLNGYEPVTVMRRKDLDGV